MRYLLRQDADIIMCGELDSLATAEVAVRAAMTGRLVLTTLHCNDAVGLLRRLTDMGVQRSLIADSLVGATAQRLLRKVCKGCQQPHRPTPEEVPWLHESGIEDIPEEISQGAGCEECRQTGYRGRTGVHEVFVMDEDIRAMLHTDADMAHIEQTAARNLVPMRCDAAQKVVARITDAAEATRIFRHITARQ